MTATESRIIEDQLRWSVAPDYAAVLNLNRQYLRGEMKTTPYDHRPMDDKAMLDPNLLHLHDYGFLTFGWQSGGHIVQRELNDNGESVICVFERRECLCFLMPLALFNHDGLQKFWLSLIRHPALVTQIVARGEWRHHPAITASPPATGTENLGTEPYPTVTENLGTKPYPTVRRRTAKTIDRVKDAVYETCSYAPSIPAVIHHSTWKCGAVSQTHPLEIWVATKQWDGKLRVAGLIEELALAAGLKMAYGEGSASEEVDSAASETESIIDDDYNLDDNEERLALWFGK